MIKSPDARLRIVTLVGLKKKIYCLLSALDKTRMSKDDKLGVEVY